MRHCGPVDADDVVAETFAVAWRRIDVVPEPAIGWLIVTARNVVSGRRRTERKHVDLARLAAETARHDEPAAEEVAVRRRAVLDALDALSEREREALLLTAWDGLDHAAAAAVAGCSTRAFRAPTDARPGPPHCPPCPRPVHPRGTQHERRRAPERGSAPPRPAAHPDRRAPRGRPRSRDRPAATAAPGSPLRVGLAAAVVATVGVGGVAYATGTVPSMVTDIVDDFGSQVGVAAADRPEMIQTADSGCPTAAGSPPGWARPMRCRAPPTPTVGRPAIDTGGATCTTASSALRPARLGEEPRRDDVLPRPRSATPARTSPRCASRGIFHGDR